MTTPTKSTTPLIKDMSASDILEAYWKAHQYTLAKSTEQQIRAATPDAVLFSCACQEWLDKYITHDPQTIETKKQCQLLQSYDDPVLIIGPTGTGKELLARALHGSRQGKFVAVNCTSLPDELLESELFGHVEGAFTGAIKDRAGKFRSAWNGTVFLDEIGDMPMSFQAKLLRVLQEKVVCPIGSDKEEKINCRIIAATNRTDISDKTKFREDLYWRLAGFILRTTGLLDRVGDIEHIVDALGGEGLVNEFEKWKVEAAIQIDNHPSNTPKSAYSAFFNLQGNVRSLQAQVRKYIVTGKY